MQLGQRYTAVSASVCSRIQNASRYAHAPVIQLCIVDQNAGIGNAQILTSADITLHIAVRQRILLGLACRSGQQV